MERKYGATTSGESGIEGKAFKEKRRSARKPSPVCMYARALEVILRDQSEKTLANDEDKTLSFCLFETVASHAMYDWTCEVGVEHG
jgi:hypothetical protein